MNLSNWLKRWGLICRLKLRQTLLNRRPGTTQNNLHRRLILQTSAAASPSAFRRRLRLNADDVRSFDELSQPWQTADFAVLDAAWLHLARYAHTAAGTFQRAWIERPRGHAKTSDMAVQIAWILLFATRPLRGVAAAADRDQAGLIWDAAQRLAKANPELCEPLEFRKHLIANPHNGSRLDIISSDVQSSWGLLPDFVICDELCHWEKPEMWYSLLSSAAKKPECVLTVLTNAGVGRDWQWEAREAARTSGSWYFSTLAGSHAPWIRPDWLDEQRTLLPRPVFDRLWLNLWQHSDGEFVTLAEAEACRDERLKPQFRGQPHRHYIAAIDYAEKHDYTVGVVVHVEASPGDNPFSRDPKSSEGSVSSAAPHVVVDRMDVAVPTPESPVRVEWVEDWMEQVAARFERVTFVMDEYQLLGSIQRLEARYDIRRFEFRAGRGNHALAMNLRRLIVHRQVRWYLRCGELADQAFANFGEQRATTAATDEAAANAKISPAPRDDLETELASLILRQSASGLCRIDHKRDNRRHDDRAFALGAACLHAIELAPASDWLQITPPTTTGDFNW